MKPYSIDLRKRVIDLIETGSSQAHVSRLLQITKQTICKWWKLYKEESVISPKKAYFVRTKKIDCKKLEEYIINNKNATLHQIGKQFDVSYNAVFKTLKKLGYSYKKKEGYILNEMKKKEKDS